MRRAWPPLAVLLLLAAFGGLAWLTRHPASPALERATRWPLVGGAAAAFRARYLPAPRVERPAAPPPADVVIVLPPRTVIRPGGDGEARPSWPAEARGALPWLWLAPGDVLRAEPDDAAAVRAVADRLANVVYVESRGDWRRITWRGVEGWVRARPEDEPPLGRAPEPVLPAPARPPDAAAVATARARLGAAQRQGRLGPYPLFTDVDAAPLLDALAAVAGGVEESYRQRYGVTPVGEPAEVVVLFRSCDDYASYHREVGGPGRAAGHVAQGIVALCRGDRPPEDVRATFLHELSHLLNRRALGPALPPWLDEGIADDLAQSRVEAGRPVPGTTAAVVVRTADAWEVHGGLASADLLRRAAGAGTALPLPELLALDAAGFRAVEPPTLGYAQASFFVRFLLAGPYAERFRGYLAGIAGGGPATPEALAATLGASLQRLDGEYRAWLERSLPLVPM